MTAEFPHRESTLSQVDPYFLRSVLRFFSRYINLDLQKQGKHAEVGYFGWLDDEAYESIAKRLKAEVDQGEITPALALTEIALFQLEDKVEGEIEQTGLYTRENESDTGDLLDTLDPNSELERKRRALDDQRTRLERYRDGLLKEPGGDTFLAIYSLEDAFSWLKSFEQEVQAAHNIYLIKMVDRVLSGGATEEDTQKVAEYALAREVVDAESLFIHHAVLREEGLLPQIREKVKEIIRLKQFRSILAEYLQSK